MNNINTTIHSNGRFANQFFRNMCAHFIAKINNIRFTYSNFKEFQSLGIDLFAHGINTYKAIRVFDDETFVSYIKNNTIIHANICVNHMYAQTNEFANMLRFYFHQPTQKNQILFANPYKERYSNNNDAYIHVRLGDIKQFNPGFQYYDSVLKNLSFEKGYISSDSIDDEICANLIKKYNLNIVALNEVQTIQFATTCKYIILSHGTFSWLIGIFSFFSSVYYPKVKNAWHGDIFVFDDWKCIDY